MPKFKILKPGVNEQLLESVSTKVEKYLNEWLFEPGEVIQIEDLFTFQFGSVSVNVRVKPWHAEDVLIEVFSYVAEDVRLNYDTVAELLRLNATTNFGSFGLTFDNSIIYTYSLAGANVDLNEFLAAVQSVAMVADQYDEFVREASEMLEGID